MTYIDMPAPIGSWSSLHGAAEALWKRAEARYPVSDDPVDPAYLLEGALALGLDAAEDARRHYELPMDATLADVLPFIHEDSVREGLPRLRYIESVLRYAIETDIEGPA